MCAHIGQNRDIYRRVYTGYIFDSIPPPPIPQVDGGGCYREKFFFDFYFSDFARNLRMVGLRIFFEFYTRYSYLEKFFYFFKTLLQLVKFSLGIPYQLLSFLVLYLSDFDLEFTSSRLRFSTLIIILDSVSFDSEFRLVFTR